MKKFWVLAYDRYYPDGGLGNVYHVTEDWDDALITAERIKHRFDYVEVMDISAMLGLEATHKLIHYRHGNMVR